MSTQEFTRHHPTHGAPRFDATNASILDPDRPTLASNSPFRASPVELHYGVGFPERMTVGHREVLNLAYCFETLDLDTFHRLIQNPFSGETFPELRRRFPSEIDSALSYTQFSAKDPVRALLLSGPPGEPDITFPRVVRGMTRQECRTVRLRQRTLLEKEHETLTEIAAKLYQHVMKDPSSFWQKDAAEIWRELNSVAFDGRGPALITAEFSRRNRRLVHLGILNFIEEKENILRWRSIFCTSGEPTDGTIARGNSQKIGMVLSAPLQDVPYLEAIPGALIVYLSPRDYAAVNFKSTVEEIKSHGVTSFSKCLPPDLQGHLIVINSKNDSGSSTPNLSPIGKESASDDAGLINTRRHEVSHAMFRNFNGIRRVLPTESDVLRGIRKIGSGGALSEESERKGHFLEEKELHRQLASELARNFGETARDELLAYYRGSANFSPRPLGALGGDYFARYLVAVHRELWSRSDLSSDECAQIYKMYQAEYRQYLETTKFLQDSVLFLSRKLKADGHQEGDAKIAAILQQTGFYQAKRMLGLFGASSKDVLEEKGRRLNEVDFFVRQLSLMKSFLLDQAMRVKGGDGVSAISMSTMRTLLAETERTAPTFYAMFASELSEVLSVLGEASPGSASIHSKAINIINLEEAVLLDEAEWSWDVSHLVFHAGHFSRLIKLGTTGNERTLDTIQAIVDAHYASIGPENLFSAKRLLQSCLRVPPAYGEDNALYERQNEALLRTIGKIDAALRDAPFFKSNAPDDMIAVARGTATSAEDPIQGIERLVRLTPAWAPVWKEFPLEYLSYLDSPKGLPTLIQIARKSSVDATAYEALRIASKYFELVPLDLMPDFAEAIEDNIAFPEKFREQTRALAVGLKFRLLRQGEDLEDLIRAKYLGTQPSD